VKTIVFTAASAKQFDALPLVGQTAIEAALTRCAIDGHGDAKRLSGRDRYRLRVGEYRGLFDESRTMILAVHIGRRTTMPILEEPMAKAPHQTIKSPSGEELVVLPRAEYDRLVATAAEVEEELADIAAYDAALAELADAGASPLPTELSALLLKYKSRLAAARRWRGVTQAELAAKVGVRQGYLSDLETKRRKGLASTIEKLAAALDVPVEWIA
jgi:DNA-binding XRE family transcriptional regulator